MADIIARGMASDAKTYTNNHFVAGSNILMDEQEDGTVSISVSGTVSADDEVARQSIATHVDNTDNPHGVTKTQVGLDNVDNTSDADKPISTATQTALDNKARTIHNHTVSEITDFSNNFALKADKTYVDSQVAEKADKPINLNFKMLDIKSRGIYNQKCINVLGDSISWGANTPDIYADSWASIARRMIQSEYNTKNYGFCPICDNISNASGTYQQMHTIAKTGTWTYTEYSGVIGAEMLSTTEMNAALEITTKIPCNTLRIHYVTGGSRGNFDVEVDGVVISTISAYATIIDTYVFTDIAINKADSFTFKIINKGNETVISGLSYLDNTNDVVFNNFGKSALALTEISDITLSKILDCNVLFFALGVNDTWKSNITAFRNKITFCINEINALGTKVIVLDLLNAFDYNNEFRAELRRLADSVSGDYIEFTTLLGTSVESELKTLGFLSDNVHPTILGHQFIAETIAKRTGFNINSKSVSNYSTAFSEIPQKANKVQEAWKNATLSNGWIPYTDFPDLKYYKDDFGIVRVKGLITGGTSTAGTIITTLPIGYKTDIKSEIPCISSSDGAVFVASTLHIETDGSLKCSLNVKNNMLVVDFSFRVSD